jgi:hypothetical protein
MRHLWSLLAGLIAAPLAWVLVAMGQGGSTRTVTKWVDSGHFDTSQLIGPAVYLGVAGVLLGLIGTLRFSPLGPIAGGLLLVAPYAAVFHDPFEVRDRVPDSWRLLGDPLDLWLPLANGTLALLGMLLLMATFSAKRWRRWPATTPEPYATSAAPYPEPNWTPQEPIWTPAPSHSTLEFGLPASEADTVPTLPTRPDSPWSAPPGRQSEPPTLGR